MCALVGSVRMHKNLSGFVQSDHVREEMLNPTSDSSLLLFNMGVISLVGSVASRVPLALRAAKWAAGKSQDGKSDHGSELEDGSDDYASAESSPHARQLVHNRLIKNRSADSDVGNSVAWNIEAATTGVDEEALHGHVDRYLNDQNKKFDDLIYKNLNAVLEQQSGYDENKDAENHDTESTTYINSLSNAVTSRIGGIAGRIKLFGFRQQEGPDETRSHILPETRALQSSIFNEAIAMDDFLDSLDYETKTQLLKMLRRDLGLTNDEELERLVLNENDIEKLTSMNKFETTGPLIDKIQLFVLVWIKLAFIGIKLMIPISYLVYTKFANNLLFLFNNRNFNKLLLICIRFMRTVEHKLNNDRLQPYQYGYEKDPALQKELNFARTQQNLDELYDEMTLNASTFFHHQLDIAEKNSWTRSMAGYMLGKYLGTAKNQPATQQPTKTTVNNSLHVSQHSLYMDPKYSKYFATPPATANGSLSPTELGSRSLPGSSSNLNSFSVMELAQQFANELI